MKPQLRSTILHATLAVSLLGYSASALAQPQKAVKAGGTYVGTGSCSSSNCHGSVNPITSGHVLQNEYVTWQRHDHHSRAYRVLANEDSQIIAKHLNLGNPQREPLCLKCHATYVPEVEQRGEKFQVEDGVSCEACHGAAGKWLTTHTEKDSNHEKNLDNGMVDLVSVHKRTALCLTCHEGGEDKTVDHRLIGAGHPRLSFEIDTFESIMPRHWEMDEEYVKRKGSSYRAAEAWLQGQSANARESIDKLSSKKRATNGIFPEFTMFNCYSCHHSLTEDQWKSRSYGDHVGEPTLNLASFQMLREALKVLKPKSGAELERLLAGVHKEFKEGKATATFAALKKLASDPIVMDPTLSTAQRQQLFRQLSSFGANAQYLPYETAEQVVMGLSSLSAEDPDLASSVKSELDEMYAALANEEAFAPEAFTNAAKRLAGRR